METAEKKAADAANAADAAARAADAASSRLDARVAAFAAAVVAADAARETLRVVAVDACESSAPSGDREMTLTLDVAAPVGRRLVAVVGPAAASSAYDERVQLRTLRPGLRLVVAAPRGRGRRESPRTTTLADLLLEAVPLAPRVEEKFQDDDDREGPRPGSFGSAMKTARFAKGAARRARALAEKESGSRLGSRSSGSGSSGSRSGSSGSGSGSRADPTPDPTPDDPTPDDPTPDDPTPDDPTPDDPTPDDSTPGPTPPTFATEVFRPPGLPQGGAPRWRRPRARPR